MVKLTLSASRDYGPAMTEPDALLTWLAEAAEKITWKMLAIEIGGVDEDTAYGWHRRGRVPKWRRPAIEAARERLTAKEAAAAQTTENPSEKAA